MSQFLFPAPQPALASWPANCSSSRVIKWCFMPVAARVNALGRFDAVIHNADPESDPDAAGIHR